MLCSVTIWTRLDSCYNVDLDQNDVVLTNTDKKTQANVIVMSLDN